jgi:hypothetical protein
MPSNADATRALAHLESISAGLRAAAIFDETGSPLAVSEGAPTEWKTAAAKLWSEADGEAGPVAHLHIAGPDGEVYGLRHGGLSLIAVTDRFGLASLVLADLRMTARDLLAGTPGRDRSVPSDEPQE